MMLEQKGLAALVATVRAFLLDGGVRLKGNGKSINKSLQGL